MYGMAEVESSLYFHISYVYVCMYIMYKYPYIQVNTSMIQYKNVVGIGHVWMVCR